MKTTINRIVVLIFVNLSLFPVHGAEKQHEPVPANPKDGVYFTCTGVMTTVLELKDGKFRYWFESDEKDPDEPTYPLLGEFKVIDGTITLEHKDIHMPQKQWSFRTIGGVLSLWRSDALNAVDFGRHLDLQNLKDHGAGSILVGTPKSAEKVWETRSAPSRPASRLDEKGARVRTGLVVNATVARRINSSTKPAAHCMRPQPTVRHHGRSSV